MNRCLYLYRYHPGAGCSRGRWGLKHATTQSTGEPLPALQAGGYGRTQRLNQLDPPKQFPLDRMRLSLRDLLVIGPPLLAKKERQVQAINKKILSFMTEQLNDAVRLQGL